MERAERLRRLHRRVQPEIDEYSLRYKKASEGTSAYTYITTTSTSYSLTGLSGAELYDVHVRSSQYDSDGNHLGYSEFVETTATPATYNPPTSFSVVATSTAGQLSCTWSAPTGFDSNDRYHLRYRQSGTDAWTNHSQSAASRTLSGLSHGITYEVEVRAEYRDSNGNTEGYSSFVSDTATTTVYNPPTSFSVVATSTAGQLSCTWSAPTGFDSNDRYHLRYRQSGTAAWTNHSQSAASRTLSGLSHGIAYEVQVRAQYRDSGGTTQGYSSFVSATATTTAYNPPTNFSVAATSTAGQLSCTWSAPSGIDSNDRYHLRYRQSGTAAWTNIGSITSTSRTHRGDHRLVPRHRV